jgi:prepilin-type N-terminal cleavage/methylation domain-containing protein
MHSGNRKRETGNTRARGFTLLEMIIVISIMLILVSIAVPNYVRSMHRAPPSTTTPTTRTPRRSRSTTSSPAATCAPSPKIP